MTEVDESSALLEPNHLLHPSVLSDGPSEPKAIYSRWQSFAGVCFFVSMVGTTYAFGVYSKLLIDNLGFSQTGVDIIASVGNTGLYLSLFVGFGIETLGLRTVVRIGGIFIFVGFMYIYLAVKEWVPSDIASISIFFFISQFGVSCHVASAITCCIRLFPPEWRGSSVGLGKGYFALSSAVLSDFDGGFFENTPAVFLLFIAIIVPTIGTIGVSMVNFLPPHMISFDFEKKNNLSSSFLPFYVHWVTLFVTLLIVGYIQYAVNINDFVRSIFAFLLAAVLISILWLPDLYGSRSIAPESSFIESSQTNHVEYGIGNGMETNKDNSIESNISSKISNYINGNDNATDSPSSNKRRNSLSNSSSSSNHSNSNISKGKDSEITVSYSTENDKYSARNESSGSFSMPSSEDKLHPFHSHNTHQSKEYESFKEYDQWASDKTELSADDIHNTDCFYGPSMPISQSINTWRFWCLYFIYFTISGTGLMVIYNVDAIAEALNKYPSSFFVTLVSLANGAGRFTIGISSDHLLKYYSKLQIMSCLALLMSITQGLFAIGSTTLLYPCLLLVGFLFGGIVSLVAVNIAEIFGSKYVSTNFGAIDSAPIAGSYCFVTFIVSLFYITNTTTYDDYYGSNSTCIGSQCFRIPFIINSTCCLFAAVLCYILHVYTPIKRYVPSHH